MAGLTDKMVFTTAVIYRLEAAGLDALQLVLVGTMLELTVLIFEVPTGILADLYSRRLSVILGTVLIGIGFVLEGTLPVFWIILLAQFVWGFGYTFTSGAEQAWITDEIGIEAAGKVFIQARQTFLAGSLLAIPLGVSLASRSLALPYLVGGSVRVLFGLLLIAWMAETNFSPRAASDRETFRDMYETSRRGWKNITGNKMLIIYSGIILFVGLYSEGWDRLYGAHLIENFRFPDVFGNETSVVVWFGILSALTLIGGIAANEAAKRMVKTTNTSQLMGLLSFIHFGMVAAMVWFAATGNFSGAVVGVLLFGILRSTSYPLESAWVNQQIQSEVRATVLSMQGQIDALGQISGGLLIGYLGRLTGVRSAILSAAGILLPAPVLYTWLWRLSSKKGRSRGPAG
jgi:DHA3 family tetracycline resistance protein-like MFS transporter